MGDVISATVRVVRKGHGIAHSEITFGTERQLMKEATGLMGRYSGDAVTIVSNNHTVASRSKNPDGSLSKWRRPCQQKH